MYNEIDNELSRWLARPETQERLKPVRELQSVLVEMLQVLDELCRKHNLRYYLYYGSLLGAVRHGGFIPWDDDADIAMPRKDYDRFVEIAERELPRGYFMQSYRTERDYRHPFAKVRKDGTTCIVNNHRHIRMHQGIFVDVFPLESLPRNGFLKMAMWALIRICDDLAAFAIARLPARLGFMRPLQWLWQGIFAPRFFLRLANGLARLFNYNAGRELGLCCYHISWRRFKANIMNAGWLGDGTDVELGENRFRIPNDSTSVLRKMYGDYMKIPAENLRVPSHTQGSVIDIGADFRTYLSELYGQARNE